MTKNKVSVAISLPRELANKIESTRGELTRSLVYRKIIEQGLEATNHGSLAEVKRT